MTASSKEELRQKSRIAVKEIPIPGIGVTLRVRQFTPAQLDEFRDAAKTQADIASWLIANCVVDEKTQPVWTIDEVRAEVYFRTREIYATAIMEVNDLSEKTVEAAGKNSMPDPSSKPDSSSHSG